MKMVRIHTLSDTKLIHQIYWSVISYNDLTDTIRSTEEESTLSSKVNDLNLQLTQEQRIRLQLEETVRSLEAQITICSKPTSVIQGQTIIKQVISIFNPAWETNFYSFMKP